jgi:hypothetical protein
MQSAGSRQGALGGMPREESFATNPTTSHTDTLPNQGASEAGDCAGHREAHEQLDEQLRAAGPGRYVVRLQKLGDRPETLTRDRSRNGAIGRRRGQNRPLHTRAIRDDGTCVQLPVASNPAQTDEDDEGAAQPATQEVSGGGDCAGHHDAREQLERQLRSAGPGQFLVLLQKLGDRPRALTLDRSRSAASRVRKGQNRPLHTRMARDDGTRV